MSTYRDGLGTATFLCCWVFHPLFPNTEEYSIQTSQWAISKAVLGCRTPAICDWIYSFSISRATQMASSCLARNTPPLSVMRRCGAIWKSSLSELACAAQDQLQSQRYLADRSRPAKLLEKPLHCRPTRLF